MTAEEEIDDPAHRSQTIRRAKEYIHSHLGEDLSLSEVAAKVNISMNTKKGGLAAALTFLVYHTLFDPVKVHLLRTPIFSHLHGLDGVFL